MLILGAQILLGFQFREVFSEAFEQLPAASRQLDAIGLGLMVLVVALLIWLLVERWPFLPRTADGRRVAWRQLIRPEGAHQRG